MDEQDSEHVEEVGLEPVAVVRRRQPRVLWAVLAVIAVAAGALVVTATDGDGGSHPGLPVDLGAASRASGTAAAADASMAAWVHYVAGDALPALGGEGTAYRMSGEVDEAQVRRLADALGLDGAVESDGAGSWWVAGGGGRGRLDVFAGGGAHWSYFAGDADCVTEDGGIDACCAPGEACRTFSSTGVAIDCVETASGPGGCGYSSGAGSSGAPSGQAPDLPPLEGEDDARRIALDVVASGGVDVEGALVDAQGGPESRSWYVTIQPVVDGVPTGLLAGVEVSDAGLVLSGSGFLGALEPLGSYPLLDTGATIARANEQSTAPGAAEPAVDRPATAATGNPGSAGDPDAPATTVVGSTDPEAPPPTYPCKVQPDGSEVCEHDTCEQLDAGASCEPPKCPQALPAEDIVVDAPESIDCTPPIDPGVDPVPDPAPVDILLVDAERSLVLLPANDGSADAYLVPAYRFTADDGGTVDLPAVADEALSGSSTTQTTGPDTIEPPPVPEPEEQPCVLEEADSTGTTHTIQTCGTDEPKTLPPGQVPVIGVAYYVDVLTTAMSHCGFISVEVAGRWWWADGLDGDGATWAEPTEGGTLTLLREDEARFVGDAKAAKVATLVPYDRPGERPLCD